MATGRFITVEGTEGAGKTSCMSFVREYLAAHGKRVVVTREPGGTPFAEELRAMLLQPRTELVEPITELLMMFAARAQHVERVIKPALARGEWVLSDRFADATTAYQGYGRGVSLAQIQRLRNLVLGHFEPDLTLLLDLPVEVGLARAAARSTPDRFEREKVEFFERVRKGYLQISVEQPQRVMCVDATKPQNEVQQALEMLLEGFLIDEH